MEVGAVKQAFNNEVILLKRSLNQAKIQIIHKLTRKAKTINEKKTPDKLKNKLKKKADSAVSEVLILKKIKPKDLAKFIVTHKGNVESYLNKPQVDIDKACARLCLHKALQAKYNAMRNKYSNVEIDDLLLSREDRRRIKKEQNEKNKAKRDNMQNKDKKKAEENHKPKVPTVNASLNDDGDSDDDDDESMIADDRSENDDVVNRINDEVSEGENSDSNEESMDDEIRKDIPVSKKNKNSHDPDNSNDIVLNYSNDESDNFEQDDNESSNETETGMFVKSNQVTEPIKKQPKVDSRTKLPKQNKEKKKKDDKPIRRKNEKDITPSISESKVVDSFFITSTGDNYMSVFEPRAPDEVKDHHRQGNRKSRRAAMFGVKIKPRKNFTQDNSQTNYKNDNSFKDKKNNDFNNKSSSKREDSKIDDAKKSEEKLHPSWAAKKKISSILPFEGKKIMFNDD